MTEIESMCAGAHPPGAARDAGFWKRALALLIDVCLVAAAVSAVFLLLAAAVPAVGRMVTLKTPFGIGTVERTLDEKSTVSTDANSNKVINSERLTERSVLGRWIYRYRVHDRITEYEGETFVTSTRLSLIWQIDPATGEAIDPVDLDHVLFAVLMLYWILSDASRHQASLGKRVVGIKVVDSRGARLTLAVAAARNMLKIVSFVILLIGFMMAGWTRRKQALHDIVPGTFVVSARRGLASLVSEA